MVVWRRLYETVGALGGDQRGSVLPIAAAGLILTVAAGALAVDLSRAYAYRSKLHTTADAAALAAAARLPDTEAARQAALAYAAKNMPRDEYGEVLVAGDIEFGEWDPETGELAQNDPPSAVRVTTRLSDANSNPLTTVLAGVIGTNELDLEVRATAGRRAPPCIVALESLLTGLRLSGDAALEAQRCSVYVDSYGLLALRVSGGSLTASVICVTGGIQLGAFGSVSPEPTTSCPPLPDPLAAMEPPTSAGCDHNDAGFVDASVTLSPGVYCGGLTIDGDSDVTFSSGVYVIKDGAFSVRQNSSIDGSGVTFYLTGADALIDFEAGVEIALTAPTSGPLIGILFFQDRDYGGTHNWDAENAVDLRGTIYLPAGKLQSEGDKAMTPVGSCTVLIANSFKFESGSGVSIDISGSGCRAALPAPLRGTVALFE
jgi:Flp pilus assembly protein TadG